MLDIRAGVVCWVVCFLDVFFTVCGTMILVIWFKEGRVYGKDGCWLFVERIE